MSVYIDRKYLLLVSFKLERFAQKKEDLFNFRCPFCGDSKKNKLKARGYVYRKANDYFYICHNCNIGTTFSKFLDHIDSQAHKEYVFERYASGENGHSNYKKPIFDLSGPRASNIRHDDRIKITNIKSKVSGDFIFDSVDCLPEDHFAKQYIVGRKIPERFWNEIFYTDKYKDFLDSVFPSHGKQNLPNDERIVLFYTSHDGEITNVSGRAINESAIRYVTVKVSDEKKLFGLHRLDRTKKIYVFEGQFDSLFIPNSIASGDSNLDSVAEYLVGCDCVLVYDAEPRNKEIVKQIEKSIENGRSIVLFPEGGIIGKDINEMILNGLNQKDLMNLVTIHTYSGLLASLEFSRWKKC